MARTNLIDFDPAELKYYPFMVSLDISSGSCNSGNDLTTKISVPTKKRRKC